MAVAIPDDKLQEVRDRIDIVDLVGRYVGLRRAGKNWSACCPFHDERTPSFYVNPERRSYKCFGCGVYGDGIDFVMRIEGKSFLEATRRLAEIYGVHLPQLSGARFEKIAEEQAERDQAYEICKVAAEHYRETLLRRPEGAAGRSYQAERRIGEEVAETFQLGYAPAPSEAGWDHLTRALAQHKLPLPLAEKLGLCGRSERTGQYYDRFRGRLIFPIIQPGGAVIAFSGGSCRFTRRRRTRGATRRSTSTRPSLSFITRARPSSASTPPPRRSASAGWRSWSRATSTWWRCTRRASPTRSRRWAPR